MKHLALCLLAAFLLVGATPKKLDLELAMVNGDPVTVSDMTTAFVKKHGGHEKFLGGEVEARKFLDLVIDERLLIQEGYNLGLDEQPDIKKAVDEFREQKSAQYLVESELQKKAEATPEEIRAAWEKNTTTLYTARQIVLQTRDEAEEIRSSLAAGEDFETLARLCSRAQSKLYGGQLGQLGWGTMDPAWEQTVFKLEPGEYSPVFKSSQGWEIVQLQDVNPAEKPDFEKAKLKIDGILKKRKLEERKKLFSDELWAKYHVQLAEADRSPQSLLKLRTEAPETVLATWDGGSLTVKDFISEDGVRMLATLPPGHAAEAVETQLRATVNDPLVNLEAAARKVAEVPEVANEVRHYEEDLMQGALYSDHILKDITVTDEELQKYYEDHKSDLTSPERRRVSHIVVQSEAEANEIRAKLTTGSDFIELVNSKSLDRESAKSAGDLGWITKRDVPEEFKAVLDLKLGDVSTPIQSKFGWHLVKVTEIEAERQLAFDEAKDLVQKKVMEQKQRDARAFWVKKLRAAAKIKVNDRAIRKFVKESFVK